jgi:hypothetical protein
MAAQGGARTLAVSLRGEASMRSIGMGSLLAASLTACTSPASVADIPPEYLVADRDGTSAVLYLRNLHDARRSVSDRRRNGDLTKSEARALKKQQRVLQALGDRYAEDGLSESEERELAMLSQALLDLSRAPVQSPPQ